ncbi:MAG: hypothetical protein ACE5ID_02750 [Acidobacteriota bacterium]
MNISPCRRFQRRLVEEMAAGPPIGREADLEQHLEGCTACRDTEIRIRDLMAAMQAEDVPDPGASYWSSFSVRLHEGLARQAPAHRLHWRPLAAWGSLAAALLLMAWLVPMKSGPAQDSLSAPPAKMAKTAADPHLKDPLILDLQEADPVELQGTLDSYLGDEGSLEFATQLEDMTLEERRTLLQHLLAELSGPA